MRTTVSLAVALLSGVVLGCASDATSRGRSAAEPRIVTRQDPGLRSAAPSAWPTTNATTKAPASRPSVVKQHIGDPAFDPNDLPDDDSESALFRRITEVFGREGEIKDGVYRLVTPRSDLFVTMDGMDVPTGAFLESDFRFWRCPCGKLLVNGQFVVADYEANDVVDELQDGHLHVVTIAPLMLDEKPRLLVIRFQGEGRAREVASALKSALSYTGKARHAPEPADISPRNE